MSTIKVDIHTHVATGLLIATSEDLKGLYAHGRTVDDLERNIMRAIKDILEAQSGREVEVRKEGHDRKDAKAFMPSSIDFRADNLEAA